MLKLSKVNRFNYWIKLSFLCIEVPVFFLDLENRSFLEEFEEIVGDLLLKSKEGLYIFADLNIQLQDPGDSFSVAFNEVLLRLGLKQCINVLLMIRVEFLTFSLRIKVT